MPYVLKVDYDLPSGKHQVKYLKSWCHGKGLYFSLCTEPKADRFKTIQEAKDRATNTFLQGLKNYANIKISVASINITDVELITNIESESEWNYSIEGNINARL
jgi:hypothetical protein